MCIRLVAVSLAAILLACNATAQRNEALIVLEGASGILEMKQYDGAVRYELRESYPAMNALQRLTAELEKKGWRQARDEILSPRDPNDGQRGWSRFLQEDKTVFLWYGEWQNPAGARVLYDLRYLTSGNELEPQGPLIVTAIYMRPDTVRQLSR